MATLDQLLANAAKNTPPTSAAIPADAQLAGPLGLAHDAVTDVMNTLSSIPKFAVDLPGTTGEVGTSLSKAANDLENGALGPLRGDADKFIRTLKETVEPALSVHKSATDNAAGAALPAGNPLDALNKATTSSAAKSLVDNAQSMIDRAVDEINKLFPTDNKSTDDSTGKASEPDKEAKDDKAEDKTADDKAKKDDTAGHAEKSAPAEGKDDKKPAPGGDGHKAAPGRTDDKGQTPLDKTVNATTHTTGAAPAATPAPPLGGVVPPAAGGVPPLPAAASNFVPVPGPAHTPVLGTPTSTGGGSHRGGTTPPTSGGSKGTGVTESDVRQMVDDAKKRLAAEHGGSHHARHSADTTKPMSSGSSTSTHTSSDEPDKKSKTFAKDKPQIVVNKPSPGLSIRGETTGDAARGFTEKAGAPLRGVGVGSTTTPTTPSAPSPAAAGGAGGSGGRAGGMGAGMLPMGMMGAAGNMARGAGGAGGGGGNSSVETPRDYNLDEEAKKRLTPSVSGGTIAPGTSSQREESDFAAPVRRRPDSTPTHTAPSVTASSPAKRTGLFGGR